MKEWVLVASPGEAKIFSREYEHQPLSWVETLQVSHGKRKEQEFELRFAATLADTLESAFTRGIFQKLIVCAEPQFLAKIKTQLKSADLLRNSEFIGKNIENANTLEISSQIVLH